ALETARGRNLDMLRLMNDLTVALERDSVARSDLLRQIQIGGILVALVLFGLIVTYFVRQLGTLRRQETALADAKVETDRILETVNDGLFLLDEEMTIGSQHSASLGTIFATDRLADRSFLDILRSIVPEKTLKTAQDYLDLLFGDRVNEALIADLNPLDEVEVFLDQADGEQRVKYLAFGFKRVAVDGKVAQLLVQVDDITRQVRLANELRESNEQAQQQFDLLVRVLHVEPQQLSDYLDGAEGALNSINETLRERSLGHHQNRAKVDRIFREIHAVKGDASALDLGIFVERAHAFEEELDRLRERSTLEGGDFLPLTIRLDEFLTQIANLRMLIARLADLQVVVSSRDDGRSASIEAVESDIEDRLLGMTMPTAPSDFGRSLQELSNRMAQEHGKRVIFYSEGDECLADAVRVDVKDVVVQLLRNAIVHGIEAPAQRRGAGKPSAGFVWASFEPEGDDVRVVFRDDGRGLDAERLKAKAVELGLVSAANAAAMNAQQALALIFRPGFSTAEQVDVHAGRGVGMDVVAARLKSLGARIGIRNVPGRYCEFRLSLPNARTITPDLATLGG
ncbi:MAG: ATP-binding protein, partial [Pseudomonadota bacterium]